MGASLHSQSKEPSLDLIKNTVQTKLPFLADLSQVVPLAGDASNRRYYRLNLQGASAQTLILMQLADPEGFKTSEEAVSGSPLEISELPFVNILRHLSKAEVVVPALYYYDENAGLLYLEDFGDLTLASCLKHSECEIESMYSKAIDTLVRIHLRATVLATPECIAFSRSFDLPLLMWEFDHFLEFGVVARQGKPIDSKDEHVIRAEFRKIAERMASQPQVFTHRDYHSRNLIVDGDRLGVIDFQDALKGPVTYDLASLLRDSYIELDEKVIDVMIDRYRYEMCEGVSETMQEQMLLRGNGHEFRKLFDFTSIQRNFKAAGRFVYIDRVKNNPQFLSAIPRTLGYVRQNLEKYPELHALLTCLTPYVPEWQ